MLYPQPFSVMDIFSPSLGPYHISIYYFMIEPYGVYTSVIMTLLARARIYIKHYRLGIYLASISLAYRKENILYILMQFLGPQCDKKWSPWTLLFTELYNHERQLIFLSLFRNCPT